MIKISLYRGIWFKKGDAFEKNDERTAQLMHRIMYIEHVVINEERNS